MIRPALARRGQTPQGEDKPSPLLWFDSSQAEIVHSRGDGLSSPWFLSTTLSPYQGISKGNSDADV